MRSRLPAIALVFWGCSTGSVAAATIQSPLPGARVTPGQPVTVVAAPGPGETIEAIAVVTRRGVTQPPAGVMQADVTIPLDAVGPEFLVLFAMTAGGSRSVASVEVVADPGPLSFLTVEAPAVLDRVGQVMPLEVIGRFDDGVERDLTHGDLGTTYRSSDPDVLAVHPTGVVQARRRGMARVLVSSRGRSATVTIRVAVPDPSDNRIPVPNAGADRVVLREQLVDLDGRASADPDGEALTYSWQQESGPAVLLRGADTATPYFVSPVVSTSTVLEFSLVVSDSRGATSFPTIVRITVNPQ